MSDIGSVKGSRRVLLLKELASRSKKPEPVLVSTLEEDKDNEGDIIIKDLVNITIIYSAEVNTLPKFRGEVGKLKEFITKLQIYYKYNFNSFNSEVNKVTYTISYIEGLVFKFIEIFLLNYKKKEKLCIKETNIIFGNVKYFFKILKVIYREPYKKEAWQRKLILLRIGRSYLEYVIIFL